MCISETEQDSVRNTHTHAGGFRFFPTYRSAGRTTAQQVHILFSCSKFYLLVYSSLYICGFFGLLCSFVVGILGLSTTLLSRSYSSMMRFKKRSGIFDIVHGGKYFIFPNATILLVHDSFLLRFVDWKPLDNKRKQQHLLYFIAI